MRQILISIFLITYSSFALADFSLTCENFQGIQFELGDKLSADANIATDSYNTKDDLDKLNDSINNCKKIFNLK